MEFHFRLRPKMKNVGLQYTSQKGLGLEMQSLGLGLEKSLDYITELLQYQCH